MLPGPSQRATLLQLSGRGRLNMEQLGGGAPVGRCPLGPALHWRRRRCSCVHRCPSWVLMCSHFLCTICDIVPSNHRRVGNETGQMNEQCFQCVVMSGCLLHEMQQYGAVMLWHRLPEVSRLCLCRVNVCKCKGTSHFPHFPHFPSSRTRTSNPHFRPALPTSSFPLFRYSALRPSATAPAVLPRALARIYTLYIPIM